MNIFIKGSTQKAAAEQPADDLTGLQAEAAQLQQALSAVSSEVSDLEAQRANLAAALSTARDPSLVVILLGQRDSVSASLHRLTEQRAAFSASLGTIQGEIEIVQRRREAEQLAVASTRQAAELQQHLEALKHHLEAAKAEALEAKRIHGELRNMADRAAALRGLRVGVNVSIPAIVSEPASVMLQTVSSDWTVSGDLAEQIRKE